MDAGTWTPLAGVALGAIGTFAVTAYTQRRADSREEMRLQREDTRNAAAAAREELARTFEHRRVAYETFISAWRDCFRASYWIEDQPSLEQLTRYYDPVTQAETQVTLYGSPEAVNAAAECATDIYICFKHPKVRAQRPALRDQVQKEFETFQRIVRHDLGITDSIEATD